MPNSKIFISHRSNDKEIVECFIDFLISLGIPRVDIFCSSLPGNDVTFEISGEIKEALNNSIINIVFLSFEYYKSAYCLNEAGVIWFVEQKCIVIATPDINPGNMLGFLNSENKIRRLDLKSDIAAISDILRNIYRFDLDATVFNNEADKLIKRYLNLLEDKVEANTHQEETAIDFEQFSTDDEKIIIYYLFINKKMKTKIDDIKKWVTINELYGVDISNGLVLLEASNIGEQSGEDFILKLEWYKSINKMSNEIENSLKQSYESLQSLSSNKFETLYSEKQFSEIELLFIEYIIDQKQFVFGARWMSKGQIEHIKQWEKDNILFPKLSDNYDECLETFMRYRFIYESDWTSHGNAKEYTLHQSLRIHLVSEGFSHIEDLNKIIEANSLF